jgi:hypothetical protein
MHPAEAAAKTWTGQSAAAAGFVPTALVAHGKPGKYENVKVSFTKKK